MLITQQLLKLEKKRTYLESLKFHKLMTKFENYNFHQIKLTTDFQLQPSYLVGERASLGLKIVKATHCSLLSPTVSAI